MWQDCGQGLASHVAFPLIFLHTCTPHQDYLSWLGQGVEQLQCWAGCYQCVYIHWHLSSRPQGGFLKVSHRACSFYMQHCCDATSLCPSCHTSVAVQSFLLHPSPSPVPDMGFGTRRGETWGWAVTERPSE